MLSKWIGAKKKLQHSRCCNFLKNRYEGLASIGRLYSEKTVGINRKMIVFFCREFA
jgi:hypothetical protein